MAFSTIYESNKRSFRLTIKIKTRSEKKFRVFAEEYQKVNSQYANREISVNGERSIYFSFVVSPEKLFIGIINCADLKDVDFEVEMLESFLPTYNIHVDSQAKKFIDFSTQFSQICGHNNATPNGRPFVTKDKEFTIKYYDVIRDKGGSPMSTPARIMHASGIIDVAECKFDNYTVAMREIILLHEFSHKYRNPKIGLQINNEFGADINALYYYLGMGWSKIDAITVFMKVFLSAQTEGNMKRARVIMDYINRFEKGEFAERN